MGVYVRSLSLSLSLSHSRSPSLPLSLSRTHTNEHPLTRSPLPPPRTRTPARQQDRKAKMIQEIKGILATRRASSGAQKRGYEKGNAPSAPSATTGIDPQDKKEK